MGTIKYDVLAVFLGPLNATGNYTTGDIRQLKRVQNTNYSINIERENTLSLGTANANDNISTSPEVSLNVGYLVTDGRNENNLGFITDGKHGSLASLNSGERDLFMLINSEGSPMVISIGNAILSNYSVNGELNNFLKASASFIGYNINVDEGTSGNFIPKVDLNGIRNSEYTYRLPEIDNSIDYRDVGSIEENIYVGPANLSIEFPNNSALGVILSGDNKSHLQNFSLSLGLDRTKIERIGNRYACNRYLQLPLELNLSASLLLSKLTADKIQNYFCQDDYDIDISILSNKCNSINEFWDLSSEPITKLKYLLRGMKLKSFASSDSIDQRKSIDLEWSVQIGNILDLQKNLFISGDFGQYKFPVSYFKSISGEESVTGYGFEPIEKEITFKRTKIDTDFPDFQMELNSPFILDSGEASSLIYYDGNMNPEIFSGFNSEIEKLNYIWNSDSYSTVFNGLPESGYTQKFNLLKPPYATGNSEAIDKISGEYYFYFQGDGFNTEPINLKFANIPSYLKANFENEQFSIDPYKPYYFNKFSLGIEGWDVPTGTPFNINIIAYNSKIKKIYTLNCESPYSFHNVLTSRYSKRTSFWLEPYTETIVNIDSNNYITDITDYSLKGRVLNTFSGSGNLPEYKIKQLNNKSYIHIDSGAYLINTGTYFEDIRNFTFFVITNMSSNSESGAHLLKFYKTQESSGNKAEFHFGRQGNSQDIEFSFTSIFGPSGISGTTQPIYHLPNGLSYDTWNLSTIYYDGSIVSGRLNGIPSGSGQNMELQNNEYNRLEIGSGFNGDIAEIILFPYRLLDSEILEVENLLKIKWGI